MPAPPSRVRRLRNQAADMGLTRLFAAAAGVGGVDAGAGIEGRRDDRIHEQIKFR